MAGVVQRCRAEADRFPVKGLSRVGSEMDLGVGRRQRWIAQVDLIRASRGRQLRSDRGTWRRSYRSQTERVDA